MKTSRFDISEHLDNEEVIAEYINAALEEGDDDLLLAAISDVAKARGMTQVAANAGVGRESLYKSLKPGARPSFQTIHKLLKALGVKITFEPADA
jgi:probable addiction module antidote protein